MSPIETSPFRFPSTLIVSYSKARMKKSLKTSTDHRSMWIEAIRKIVNAEFIIIIVIIIIIIIIIINNCN